MPDSLDLNIKNTKADSVIKITDYINLDNAIYVSKAGRKETLTFDAANRESGSNTELFNSLSAKIKKEFDKPVLIGAADATHYNFVNDNYCWYSLDSIEHNAKTWIVKSAGGNWGRPVQYDHSDSQRDVIGRVYAATPFKYEKRNDNNLDTPDGHIELIWVIPDAEAIAKIVDGRMRTVSVGASTTPDQIKCSICLNSPRSADCNHYRGNMYDVEDKKQLAYWKFNKKTYGEVSFVSNPADKRAVQKNYSLINIDGKAQDSQDLKRSINEFTNYTFAFGNQNEHGITGMVDLFGDKLTTDLLISRDSILDESVKIASSQSSEDGNKSSASTQISDQNTDNIDDSEEDQVKLQAAIIGLVYDMLKNDTIELSKALDALYTQGNFYISMNNKSSKDSVLKVLGDHLDSMESIVSPKNINDLYDHVFTGAFRTMPILDKHYVKAAKQLMDSYIGCDKTRITNNINRKESILIGDKMQINLHKEDKTVSKFTFDSEEALLASAPVQKAIDEVKTANEQALDKINKEFSDKESKLKEIAVDAIISASLKLNKPLTGKLSSLSGDEAVKERKNISDRLHIRSFDSLVDSVNDYNEELAHVVEKSSTEVDPNQGKIDAALTSKDSVATPASADAATTVTSENATTTDSVSQPDTSTAAPTSATASATKPAETINQADASSKEAPASKDADTSSNKIQSILSSITKKK
jgi:hypothetical protein